MNEVSAIEEEIDIRINDLIKKILPDGVYASRGIVFLQQGEQFEHILKRADKAMYHAKEKRKSRKKTGAM